MPALFVVIITLAVIQGIAEFIPISSSGHLVLFQNIRAFKEQLHYLGPDTELFLSVLLHFATLGAVLIYLHRDIRRIIAGCITGIRTGNPAQPEIRILMFIIAGSIPAAVAGIVLHDFFERIFTSVITVFILLILNGIMLLSTKIIPLKNRNLEETGIARSLIVGIFQALAILPGISRSGSTIAGGMMMGLSPENAARFSFLLAIPVIAGAGLLEALKLSDKRIPPDMVLPLLISMAVALFVGLVSLKILFAMVKRVRIDIFGYYTMAVGFAGLGIYFFL